MPKKSSPPMPLLGAAAETGSPEEVIARGSSTRRRSTRVLTDWRNPGPLLSAWDWRVLAVVCVCAGLGCVGASVFRLGNAPWTVAASTIALWSGLAAGVVYAFLRARPSGLLRFRAIDLLWGVGLGLLLRLCQGWLSGANGLAFPSAGLVDGPPTALWWLTYLLPAGVFGPVIEEFFFRAVLLVVVYLLFWRTAGPIASAVAALLVSAGSFVLLHGAFEAMSLQDGLQLFVVAAICGQLVMLTGRVWGAVICHVVYNVTYLMLALVGTYLA